MGGCCGGGCGAGEGGVVVGKWGGIGSKMYKNLLPPISTHVFPRSIQERLLLTFHVSTVISISVITNQELSGHVIKIHIKFL